MRAANGFGENGVADEVAAVLFAENDQVVHVEVEPVPSGEVAEPIGTGAASDRNRVSQLLVQNGHRFFGTSEFFPGK